MNYNPNTLVLATRNPGKIEEIRLALAGIPLDVRSSLDGLDLPDVAETEETLEGNAALKSEAIFRRTGLPSLADDTGLEVAALGGAPGVRSARFAGEPADAAANRALMLSVMEGRDDRSARFRSVIAFTDAGGTRLFEGVCEGVIVHVGRGTGGFGYDELFQPVGFDATFAELTADTKNAISHRGMAIRRFVRFLSSYWALGVAG